jgi:hypothetical protein
MSRGLVTPNHIGVADLGQWPDRFTTSERSATALLLIGVFLFGIAHLAALPPFEGYDEVAHWSSIQQIADDGRIPVYGKDHLSADLLRYPGPFASAAGQPYRAWFAINHAATSVSGSGPSRFRQGLEQNWQAQHPPLYYMLLGPVYLLGAKLDWLRHMLALRLASWCIAFAGFAWGAVQTQAVLRTRGVADARLLLPAAWPFLFPEFFPEFARLTNDALVVLLFAGVWSLSLKTIGKGLPARRAAALGMLLGAGLLTKAFFLPITAGALGLLGFSLYRSGNPKVTARVAAALALGLSPAIAWYVRLFWSTGTLSGGNDFIHLQQAGGLWAGLNSHFSPVQYARGAVRIFAQFAWAGTWSFVHPNRWVVAPIVADLVLGSVFYIRACRVRDVAGLAPLFFVVPFLCGLFYHLLVMVATHAEGMGTPGWYLHILAAPLSMVLAIGWRWRRLQSCLAAYGIAFGAMMAPWQLAFFSGCLERTGNGGGTLAGSTCLIDFGHLKVIALPGPAIAAGAAGVGAILAASVFARHMHRR